MSKKGGELRREQEPYRPSDKDRGRFRNLLDIIQVAIVEYGADSTIVYCNQLARSLLCIGKDKTSGKWTADAACQFHREDGSPMEPGQSLSSHVLNTDKPLQNHVIGIERTDSQELTWVLVDTYPQFEEETGLKTVVVSFLDITARKRAEAAQSRIEQRLSDLINSTAGIVWEADAVSFQFVSVSKNAERMLGYSSEEWLAPGFWASHVHPEDRSWAVEYCSACTARVEDHEFEYRFMAADGRVVWLRDIVGVVTEKSRPRWLRGLMVDVTAQKLAEKARIENEARYRSLVEHSPYCIHEIDLRGRLISMNPAGLKMMGVDDICMLRETPYMDAVGDHDRERVKGLLEGALKGKEAEFTFQASNGRKFQSSFVPISDEAGHVQRLMGITIDITEQEQAYLEKQSLERQIQHAQKLESLGVLAGGIAHDFNNLLSAVLGNAELALDSLSPLSPARNNIRAIGAASRRAADLAQQMLAYSGKGKFVVTPIDIRDLVEEMTHLLDVPISKNAILKYDFADNLPPFDGDATQIRQVVMNLIINASESIADRSGIISLSAGSTLCIDAEVKESKPCVLLDLDGLLATDLYVCLEVRDTGCGMDPETIERIFDPFFSTKFTGRGLGLSATLGIVRGHGGAIQVCSELGQGTTFRVFFPAKKMDDPSPDQKKQAQENLTTEWNGSGTILVVDDEEAVCTMAKNMVERLGFKGVTASTGSEAVQFLRSHEESIACVLLDLTMPHMDGEETYRELRLIDAAVPVILCSGYNMQDLTQRFADKGPSHFLQKPYKLSELRETLCQLLSS